MSKASRQRLEADGQAAAPEKQSPLSLGWLVVLFALLMLMVLPVGSSSPETNVTIEFAGNGESSKGLTALLRLENHGSSTVRFNAFCTLYWTNESGMATNAFLRHELGYGILRPGESNLVRVPHPTDAKLWKTSFTYKTRPSAVARLVDQFRFWLGCWSPDNSFIGIIGPVITNPAPVASRLPSAQTK